MYKKDWGKEEVQTTEESFNQNITIRIDKVKYTKEVRNRKKISVNKIKTNEELHRKQSYYNKKRGKKKTQDSRTESKGRQQHIREETWKQKEETREKNKNKKILPSAKDTNGNSETS